MSRLVLFAAALSACTGGLQWHSSSSAGASSSSSSSSSAPSSGGDVDNEPDSPNALVTAPHTAGKQYIAMLDKLDDPKPAKNFQSQDEADRWKDYRQSVA